MEDKAFTYMLEAYKTAASYYSDYADRVWIRFNIFLAMDIGLATLFLYAWGTKQPTNASQNVVLLAILGFMVSVLLYVQSAQDKYSMTHQLKRINQMRALLEEKVGHKDTPALFAPLDDIDLQKRNFIFEGIASWRLSFLSVTRIPAIASLVFVLLWLAVIVIVTR